MASSPATPLPSVVAAIDQRVEQLIAHHRRIVQINSDLTQQIKRAREAEREALERVRALEKELAIAVVGGASAKSKAKAKAQINRLMREVDNCITLLSTPGKAGEAEEAGEQVAGEQVAGEQSEVSKV